MKFIIFSISYCCLCTKTLGSVDIVKFFDEKCNIRDTANAFQCYIKEFNYNYDQFCKGSTDIDLPDFYPFYQSGTCVLAYDEDFAFVLEDLKFWNLCDNILSDRSSFELSQLLIKLIVENPQIGLTGNYKIRGWFNGQYYNGKGNAILEFTNAQETAKIKAKPRYDKKRGITFDIAKLTTTLDSADRFTIILDNISADKNQNINDNPKAFLRLISGGINSCLNEAFYKILQKIIDNIDFNSVIKLLG